MRRYIVRTDVEEIGAYVLAEVEDVGYGAQDLARDWALLEESEVEALFPGALEAWRRRDSTIAERSAGLLEACWEAEELALESD